MMDRHDDIQPMLTDYVLGELDSPQLQAVHAHLSTCEACATEARELARAFQSLGLAPEPEAPPPHLRARVLESLARDLPSSRVLERRRQTRASWPVIAAGLAAALVLALGGALALSMKRNTDLRDALGTADAETRRLAAQIANTELQADLAVSILTATDMRRIDLAGFDASRDATARAYWSPTQGLLIVADRLPAPPPGRVYQVWLIGGQGAAPVSAGLIDAASGGRGMLIVPPPGGVTAQAVTVAVTDEPRGGLPSPTGSKHLAGS